MHASDHHLRGPYYKCSNFGKRIQKSSKQVDANFRIEPILLNHRADYENTDKISHMIVRW